MPNGRVQRPPTFSPEIFEHISELGGISPERVTEIMGKVSGSLEKHFSDREKELKTGEAEELTQSLLGLWQDVKKERTQLLRECGTPQEQITAKAFYNFSMIAVAEYILRQRNHIEAYEQADAQEEFIDQSIHLSLLVEKSMEKTLPDKNERDRYLMKFMGAFWQCFHSVESTTAGKMPAAHLQKNDAEQRMSGCIGETVAVRLAHEYGLDVRLKAIQDGRRMEAGKVDQIWENPENGNLYAVQVKRRVGEDRIKVANGFDTKFQSKMGVDGEALFEEVPVLKESCAELSRVFNRAVVPLIIVIPGDESGDYLPYCGIPTPKGLDEFSISFENAQHIN